MTNFDMPNNVSSLKFAQKSVPGLAGVGVPRGEGGGPRTPPRYMEGQIFWPTLVLAGRSGMDKNPPLDSFLLPSMCG